MATKPLITSGLPLAPAARLPDAPGGNWVDRWAPEQLRPWLKLGRFDRPVGAWLLMLPGWQGVALSASEHGERPNLVLLILIFFGAFAMRGAGCAYNDIVDRHIDAKVARTALRPIPSGQISVRQAWAYVIGLSLVGLVILLTMGPLAIALGVASLLLVAAYPFMKRITWWPQAWLGLTFNWGAPLGYAAAAGTLSPAVGCLYASGIFWTLGYDTIYAVQDLEDDALVGVKSSARRLGRHAPGAVLVFYGLSLGFALGMAALARLGPLFLPIVALLAVHFIWQGACLRIDDGKGALKLFRANREAGLLLLFGIIAGLWGQGGGLMGGL